MSRGSESVNEASPRSPSPAEESVAPAWRRYAVGVALAGMYAFAAGIGGAKALQSLGMLLLLVGSLPFVPAIVRQCSRDPVSVAAVMFFAYLVLSGFAVTWDPSPEGDLGHWDMVRKMSRVLLLPLLAFWLGGRLDRINWMLLAVLLGVVAVVVEQWIQWGSAWPMLGTAQLQFRLHTIWMGLISSLAVIGLVAFRRPFIDRLAGRLPRIAAAAVWLALLLLMIQCVLVSQSRGPYLALLAGMAVLVGFWIARSGPGALFGNRLHVAAGAVLVVVVTIVVATQADTITRRFVQEQDTIQRILQGNIEDLPTNSVGTRIHLYRAGLSAIAQRPWFGWGPNGSLVAARSEGVPERAVHDHMHNGPIDVLVRFGVVGALLLYSLPVLIARALYGGIRAQDMPGAYGAFFTAAFVTMVIADLTESYIASGFGWSVLVVLGATMYTSRFWSRGRRPG